MQAQRHRGQRGQALRTRDKVLRRFKKSRTGGHVALSRQATPAAKLTADREGRSSHESAHQRVLRQARAKKNSAAASRTGCIVSGSSAGACEPRCTSSSVPRGESLEQRLWAPSLAAGLCELGPSADLRAGIAQENVHVARLLDRSWEER